MSARRSISLVLVWLCGIVGAVLLWSAPALGQRVHAFSASFGSEGSGNGQLMRPGALAVNEETGDVYVIDRGNKRVEIFSSTGTYVGQFNGSGAPSGPFSWPPGEEKTAEGAIAVDNSTNPLDPSKGDVYVVNERPAANGTGYLNVVDKFTSNGTYVSQVTGTSPLSPFDPNELNIAGIAVASGGALWVVEGGELDVFNDALVNEYVLQLRPEDRNFGSIGARIGLAVDAEDNFYFGFGQPTLVAKFTESGEVLARALDGEATTGVGVDRSSDDAYVDHETSVAAYGPSGLFVERFGSAQMHASEGIAVDSATGTVYTADAADQEVDVFTASVVPDASTGLASNLGETSATVSGVVNPDGLPVTSCMFEYVQSSEYEPEAPDPYTAGHSVPCAPEVSPTKPLTGGAPMPVSANLTGLEHLTRYHFRLKVANANGSNVGPDRTLLTPEPVAVSEASVSDVSSASALFSAMIDPGGADTTYEFEYGTSVSYGQSLPVPAGDLGPGTSSVSATVRAQGLLPATLYHVRLVAGNLLGTVYGPDQTFITQISGGAFVLPDGREWEMVSPPNKYGGQILPPGGLNDAAAIEASADGGAITYAANGPVVANPAGNPSPVGPTQVLSQRGAGGWSSEDIATPHDAPASLGNADEYLFFSSDLSKALVEPLGGTPLSPATTEKTPYLRDDETGGGYVPLVSAGDVPPGTKFSEAGETHGHDVQGVIATPDLSHALLTSEEALTSNAVHTTGGGQNIYEWSGGRLTLVTVPNETPWVGGVLGDGWVNVRHALSNDGSRVIWTPVGATAQFLNEAPIYVTDTVTGKTVQVDAPAPGVSTPPRDRSVFQTASADGSKVFFLDDEPLTLDSKVTPGGEKHDLYVYDTATGLTDLTVDPNNGEQADVLNMVLGASEDGSIVYFVAKGMLASGALAGQDNLYVESETGTTWSAPRLIAVLSGEDLRDWGDVRGLEDEGFSPESSTSELTSRVSPSGRYLAFMSDRSLTGYDNIDMSERETRSSEAAPATKVHHDEEVFLYDEATGRLRCASCNPTEARPDGIFVRNEDEYEVPLPLVDRTDVWGGRWLAASIPAWTTFTATNVGANEGQLNAPYQSRYLSNDGRLFFDSPDALVPQDTNGEEDVYEYEPPANGEAAAGDSCTVTSSTFSESSGGCLNLISSGTSGEESVFLDASESGDDVFFLTAGRLASQDLDTSMDVYDAHVCSAVAPCTSAPVSPPPCTSGDSCKAAPSPQPAVFGAPSSATFSGAGNVTPTLVAAKQTTKKRASKCRRGFVRKKGECVKRKAKKSRKRAKPSDRRRAK